MTLFQGIDIYRRVLPIFKKYNYNLCLYGSLIEKGQGRDVDVMATPKDYMMPKREKGIEMITDEIIKYFKESTRVLETYHGVMDTISVVIEIGNYAKLDIVFVPPTKKD